MSVEPRGSATSASRAVPGRSRTRRNTDRCLAGVSRAHADCSASSRWPGLWPSSARTGSPAARRSAVSDTSQSTTVRTSPPAGSDQATRACEHPSASGVLPTGTPGTTGGGSGSAGTGLAAVAVAGRVGSGDQSDGDGPTASALRTHTRTPHQRVAPKSSVTGTRTR
jgi:hypothetical protein